MKSQLSLALVVGLILVLVILMSLHDWTFTSAVKAEVLEQAPMITSENINGRIFDAKGELKYTLKAASAADFDFTQIVRLTHPQIEIFNGDSSWIVTALSGSMTGQAQKGQREIVLKDQVAAQLTGKQQAHISTEEMHYFPLRQELVSPGKIIIHQQQNTTRAGYMQANLQTGQLRLSQGVESHYVVPAS